MAQYIYTRVSTDGQSTDSQMQGLQERYPNAQIVSEVASGAKNRPMLQTLLGSLEKGDELIVAALDRLGRRTTEVLGVIEDLERRGVVLISLREGVDYSTITGKLVTQILCSVAEMERNLISERTKAALASARAQGRYGGRPKKVTPEIVDQMRALRDEGLTIDRIADELEVSNFTVSTYLRRVTEADKTS